MLLLSPSLSPLSSLSPPPSLALPPSPSTHSSSFSLKLISLPQKPAQPPKRTKPFYSKAAEQMSRGIQSRPLTSFGEANTRVRVARRTPRPRERGQVLTAAQRAFASFLRAVLSQIHRECVRMSKRRGLTKPADPRTSDHSYVRKRDQQLALTQCRERARQTAVFELRPFTSGNSARARPFSWSTSINSLLGDRGSRSPARMADIASSRPRDPQECWPEIS